jgi:hypothetical protein
MPTAPTVKYYTDHTGHFPCTSSSGNNNVLIAYHYNCYCILAEPLPNRKANNILAAHKRIIERLRRAGITCSFVMLDNECSSALQTFLHEESIKFQGYFAKIWESRKLAIRKRPSSQIPLLTYEPLAEIGF